jgi:hypothetical protein
MATQDDKAEDQFYEEKFEQLMAEKGGLVPPGFAQQVEQDFTEGNMGIARRVAMVFLEKQFSESLENVQRDRKTALAFASMQLFILDHVQNYRLLSDWLAAAHTRMMFAVCERKDSDAIYAEAERERADGKKLQ